MLFDRCHVFEGTQTLRLKELRLQEVSFPQNDVPEGVKVFETLSSNLCGAPCTTCDQATDSHLSTNACGARRRIEHPGHNRNAPE